MRHFGNFMILMCIISSRGATPVILSPSGLAPVCSGGQLELTCTTTGDFLEWDIFQIPENGTIAVNLGGRIFSSRPSQMPSYRLIESVFFNFSRVSPPNSLPLTSRLLISPANSNVNGTEIVCEDSVTSMALSTNVFVITEDSVHNHPRVNFTWRLEQSEDDSINVTLMWNVSVNPTLFSYHINITPGASFTFAEKSVTIELLLDIAYNVSIVATHLCGQAKPIILNTELFYPDCGEHSSLLGIIDYLNPEARKLTSCACPKMIPTDATPYASTGRQETDAVMVALISSVSTFALTLIVTFIIRFACGSCCIMKCKKPKAPPHHHTVVYEEVLSTDAKQREKDFELDQNIAYAPVCVK